MEKVSRFYKFRADIVINTFGIKRVKQCKILFNWLDAEYDLDIFELNTFSYKNLSNHNALGVLTPKGKCW